MKAVEEWTGVQRDGAFDVATGDGLLEVPAIDRKQGRVETEIGGGSQERVSSKSLPESERDLFEVVSRARCVEVGPEERESVFVADTAFASRRDEREQSERSPTGDGARKGLAIR